MLLVIGYWLSVIGYPRDFQPVVDWLLGYAVFLEGAGATAGIAYATLGTIEMKIDKGALDQLPLMTSIH